VTEYAERREELPQAREFAQAARLNPARSISVKSKGGQPPIGTQKTREMCFRAAAHSYPSRLLATTYNLTF
jgi:hypothetical protein